MSIDRAKLNSGRKARLLECMRDRGADSVLLLGPYNQEYVGVSSLWRDDIRYRDEPTVVLFTAPDGDVFAWGPSGEARVDTSSGHAELRPCIPVDHPEGVKRLVAEIAEVAPGLQHLVVEEYTPGMLDLFAQLLPGVELIDLADVLAPARMQKTPEEVECIRQATRIHELASLSALEAFRPGISQRELSATFASRAVELGADAIGIEPIWNPIFSPFAVRTDDSELPFASPSTDEVFQEGDLVLVDGAVVYNGYHSDYGKIWICSDDPVPTPAQEACFEQWCDLVRSVLDVVRPGSTFGDLDRAAAKVNPRHACQHLYLTHGSGLGGPLEMPLAGSDLGIEFDDTQELLAGMVFMLEPVVWRDDVVAAYRSEETVLVTESGYEILSQAPYWPFELDSAIPRVGGMS